MRELTIRLAEAADRDSLADVEFISRNAAFMEMYGTTEGVPLLEELRTRWDIKLSGRQAVIAVGEIDSITVGYFNLCKFSDGLSFAINGLYVLPEYWGRGIGGRLVSSVERVVRKITSEKNKKSGVETHDLQKPVITLEVIRENSRATAFYRKYGYEFTGKSEPYNLGCKTIFLLEMKKILD